jgi:Peptidase family M23
VIRARTAALLAPVVVASGLIAAVLALQPEDPLGMPCVTSAGSVTVTGVPAGPVSGYDHAQLVNAALVVEAGRALGIDARGQTIGLMTAMGESSLVVVDHGDAVGPDSRGLFQQRDNGAWGTYADRMDPTVSATNFFRALLEVPGWEVLPPTIAAHRTQHNADPYHYARWWDAAVEVLTSLAGTAVTGVAAGTGSLACTGFVPGGRFTAGWAMPAAGPLTSGFGLRRHPATGAMEGHAGVDLAPGCDAPILAASAGIVVRAGPSSGYGNLIVVDHGEGTVTRYAHMEDDDVLVVVGQEVTGGQQIARIGSNGDSTGCHLHFEVLVDGAPVDPLAFLGQRQSDLG